MIIRKPFIREYLEFGAGSVLHKTRMYGHAPKVGGSRIADPSNLN